MDIIQILSDGGFHSGDEIGVSLGISRAAVWKRIRKLEEQGLTVQSVRGKGYRLAMPLNLLDHEQIIALLAQQQGSEALLSLLHLDVRSAVTSTNDLALKHQSASPNEVYVCLAEQQTQGRGRRGRHWVSPYGRNIYLSYLWQCQAGASALEGLSLATGVAIVRSLELVGVKRLGLKWPNDIFVDGKKVSGVLLEMTGDPAGLCQVVLGVGVNTSLDYREAVDISQPWTDLEKVAVAVNRNSLAAILIWQLTVMLQRFERYGFGAFQADWQHYDVLKDKPITLISGSNVTSGIARGIDQTGSLLFETCQGIELVRAGEVSLRLRDESSTD